MVALEAYLDRRSKPKGIGLPASRIACAITDVIMRGTYGLIEVQIGATWQM